MTTNAKKVDASRFEGQGISFKAKLIGIEDVEEARGDQMCQAAITKLKNGVKMSGQHKIKIYVNVTLEGLKIIDAISMATYLNKKKNEKNDNRQSKTNVEGEETEKPQEPNVLHTHAVHQISFISRDVTDNRAFGYVHGGNDGKHQFFAIKTAAAAENLVLTLRDLFQVVYDMKKQEVDEAKLKLGENNTEGNADEGNSNAPGNGSTSGIGQAPTQNADAEGIYQVPPNNAPATPASKEEQVANLLDLEDQADHILKGIEQIKNLEFDSITSDSGEMSPTSPVSPASKPDPWGAPASSSSKAASDLASLSGFNTPPFGAQTQPFPGLAFPHTQTVPGMNMPSAGLPVNKDPFGNDPFAAQFPQTGVRPTAFPMTVGAPGFGAANPFGAPRMAHSYAGAVQPGMGMPPSMMGPPGMMSGMAPRGMVPPPGAIPPPGAAGAANPFSNAFGEPDPNVLVPIRNDKGADFAPPEEKPKKAHEDLFSDLVGMKKSAASAVSPKDMFAQLKAPEKKSMNELKTTKDIGGLTPDAATQASFHDADPFGEIDSIFNDKTRGLVTSDGDPFDTSHIPSLPAVPPAKSSLSPHQNIASTSPSPSPIAPPVPQRQTLQNSNNLKECSLSSSSSTSLSSSSSTFSPAVPSDPPPSITPPPLPVRRKENHPSSPSTPSRLRIKPESTPVNTFSTAASLLPSPDEPPPPLPENFISTPAAPPPPPRPSRPPEFFPGSPRLNEVRSTVKSSPQKSNLTNKSSLVSSASLSRESNEPDLNTHPLDPHNNNNNNKNDSRSISNVKHNISPQSNHAVADPFNIPLKPFGVNSVGSNDKNNTGDRLSQSSDPFTPQTPKKSINTSEAITEVQKPSASKEASAEEDPFGLPLHLTPGFKAVAKFGSDPFEDSFHSGPGDFQAQDKWDPFTDNDTQTGAGNQGSNDPWNPKPFDDAFVSTSAPPVNGNTSGNSLMD